MMKCVAFLKDGVTPCSYSKKFGDYCGIHNKRNLLNNTPNETTTDIVPTANTIETSVNVPSNENTNTRNESGTEKEIEYFLTIGDRFVFGIERNLDMLIVEDKENRTYTEKDLEYDYRFNTVNNIIDFAIDDIPKLLKYKNENHVKYRYIIGIEYNKNKLMFIPNFIKNDVIHSFSCVSFEKYETIKNERFSPNSMGYPQSQHKTLHELVYGKKSEKGGWYLIKKNNPDSNIKAIWITMISGRSVNQYDPNPDNKDFYYYYNEENGFNIKVASPEKFIEGYENIPKITEGTPGDFYKNRDGDIYVKVDEHKIDHINSVALDARTHKLREVTCSTNAINRLREDCKYIGISKNSRMYRGVIMYRGKSFSKTFETEMEAARFYDYHALALHEIMVSNNNTLSIEEQNDLLLYGIEKIPKEYRIAIKKEKIEAVGISKTENNKYCLRRRHKTIQVCKTYNTYDEAIEAWKDFENRIKEFEEKKRLDTLEINKTNFGEKYGYLIIKKGDEDHRVKLNIEVYKEFVHCNWWFTDGKPYGTYKGKSKYLHIHVIKFYNKNYNKREYGTIDHRYQDFLDCTIESLRTASQSLQVQNTKRKNALGYTGISLNRNKFNVGYKRNQKNGYIYLEDAAREYNSMVEKDLGRDEFGKINGYINNVPEGIKTTVSDLYSVEKLTLEMLQNITVSEIRSIILVNVDLRERLDISSIGNINKTNYQDIASKIIEILKF